MIDFAMITQIINWSLIGLTVLVFVGLIIAILIGLKRGIWKSAFFLIFFLTLYLIAILILKPLVNSAFNTDLKTILSLVGIGNENIVLSKTVTTDGVAATSSFVVPIGTVGDTVEGVIEGLYRLFNVAGDSSKAYAFAKSLTGSVIYFVVYFVELIFVAILVPTLGHVLWHCIFKHIIPKVVRKTVKLRIASAITTAVKYVLVLFLFASPFTAIINSFNQSYQKLDKENQDGLVKDIGSWLDAYNSSIFANLFFNWTVNGDGLTFDTAYLSAVTNSVEDNAGISLIGEIENITNFAVSTLGGITGIDENTSTFSLDNINLEYYLSQEFVSGVFSTLKNSNLLMLLMPIAVNFAVNSDLLEGTLELHGFQVDDINWEEELTSYEELALAVIDSGIVYNFIDTETKTIKTIDDTTYCSLICNILEDEEFQAVLKTVKTIDESKLLSRAFPSLIQLLIDMDTSGTMKQYLPGTWDELNNVYWGYESYVLLDSMHRLYDIDPNFVPAIFNYVNKTDSNPAVQVKARANRNTNEGEKCPELTELISLHADEFSEILVGEFKDGNPNNVDAYGRTKVFENGQQIENRHYCLFDMNLIKNLLTPVIDNLFEQPFINDNMTVEPDDVKFYEDTVKSLDGDNWLINYKKEFNNVIEVVEIVAGDEYFMNILNDSESLAKAFQDFSVPEENIQTLKHAISKIDSCKLLYAIMLPIARGALINNEEIKDSVSTYGINLDLTAQAMKRDMNRENHNLFSSLADLLDCYSDIGTVYNSIVAKDEEGNAKSTDELISLFADKPNGELGDLVRPLQRILCKIYQFEYLNPNGDGFVKDANFNNVIRYLLSFTESLGVDVDDSTLEEISKGNHWDTQFDTTGNPVSDCEIVTLIDVFRYVANHDILNAADALGDLDSKSADEIGEIFYRLSGSYKGSKSCYDLPGLLTVANRSILISSCLGDVLDELISSSVSEIIDIDHGVTFTNIDDWDRTGTSLKEMLDSFADLIVQSGSSNFINDLDFTKINDIVSLNNMLHNLANSGIFEAKLENGGMKYTFGQWLFTKMLPMMSTLEIGDENYNFLADPVNEIDDNWSWKDSWGNKTGDKDPYFEECDELIADINASKGEDITKGQTYYLVYRDFIKLGGVDNYVDDLKDRKTAMAPWCDFDNYSLLLENYKSIASNETNKESWKNESIANGFDGAFYGSDSFMSSTGYGAVLDCDEIGRLVKVIGFALRILNNDDVATNGITALSSSMVDNTLTSMNNTKSLRIATYNFYEIAKKAIKQIGGGFFNIDSANNVYMIDTGLSLAKEDFDAVQANRQTEINYLVSLFDAYKSLDANGVIDTDGNFDINKITSDDVKKLRGAITSLNKSYIFHRLGSEKDIRLMSSTCDKYYPTAFQSMLNSIIGKSDLSYMLYNENNPKDKFFEDNYLEYISEDSISTADGDNNYLMALCKTDYLLANLFNNDIDFTLKGLSETEIASIYTQESREVGYIFELLNSVIGGPMCDDDGNVIYDINGEEIKYAGIKGEEINGERKTVLDVSRADLGYEPNIESLKVILENINKSTLMFDCVPNGIYSALKNVQNDNSDLASLTYFSLDDANLFYMYDVDKMNGVFDWDAHYSDEDIDFVIDLIKEQNKSLSGEDCLFNAFSSDPDKGLSNTDLGNLGDFLDKLQESNLFHRAGPRWSFDSGMNVVMNHRTIYQDVYCEIFDNDMLSDYFYSVNSPKDINSTEYSSRSEKVEYLINNFVSYSDYLSYGDQLEENHNLIEIIAYVFGSEVDGIPHTGIINADGTMSDIDINSVSGDDVRNVLTAINNSHTLYDILPNFLYSIFNDKDFSSIGNMNFSTIDVYYQYEYQNGVKVTTNYTNHYDEHEINAIAMLIDDYQSMSSLIDGTSLMNIDAIKALLGDDKTQLLNSSLGLMLVHAHESYSMHLCNKNNDVVGELTFFEEIYLEIVNSSGLDSYAYDSSYDSLHGYINAKAKSISLIETLSSYEFNGKSINDIDGYHVSWIGDNGEVKAILDLVYDVTNSSMMSGSDVSFDGIEIDNISTEEARTLLMDINYIDVVSDAVPILVENAFSNESSMNLAKLTSPTYETNNSYAYYRIGQRKYGGNPGANEDEIARSEISLIIDIIDSLTYEEAGTRKWRDVGDIQEFKESGGLPTIMKYLFYSHVLNTSTNGEYQIMNTFESSPVSARGVMMYNLLGPSSTNGLGLDIYMTGNTPSSKMASMSKLFALRSLDVYPNQYSVESQGIDILIDNALALINIDTSDINSVIDARNIIASTMKACYNADGQYHRCYIGSEIVSHVLDQSLNNEYSMISSPYFDLATNKVDLVADDYTGITINTYDSIDKGEEDGVSGALGILKELLDIKTAIETMDLTFISSLNGMDMQSNFDLMGPTAGNNSSIASIYFLSRGYDALTWTQDATISSLIFHTTPWSDYSMGENPYASTFSFHSYGDSLLTYMGVTH